MTNARDLTGNRYGHLVVLWRVPSLGKGTVHVRLRGAQWRRHLWHGKGYSGSLPDAQEEPDTFVWVSTPHPTKKGSAFAET